ncbi:MAG TPA: response regulator [Candidatus Binatia bacterium]|jgi:CheY-like chemotaxis protein|nr:response regulator [Candidatus Binatia bacterium]
MVTFPAPVKPILVVEDEPDLRDALALELEADGYTVVTAENARDALARLRSGVDPCLVLLDMMMPGGSGLDFRREQLRDETLAAIPVIAYSGDGDLRDEAERLGVAHFFRKPVPARTLLDLIDQHRRRD